MSFEQAAIGANAGADQKQLITQSLCDCGWTEWKSLGESAIATKEVQTAAGLREAVAHLTEFANRGVPKSSYMLSGEYISEGNNALASYSVIIPKESTPAQVCQLATKFAIEAQQVISQTYAARLYEERERQTG